MNSRAILGISIAAAFAVTMILSQSAIADNGYKTVLEHEVTKNQNTINVKFVTDGPIPTDGSAGAFGYGLITGTNDDGLPENVLALTTHKCVSDSLVQDNAPDVDCPTPVAGLLEALGFPDGTNDVHDDETFHAHVLDLKPIVASSNCAGVANNIGLEVDIARTVQTQNNVSPDYSVIVGEDEVTVFDVHIGDVHSAAFKKAASVYFGIEGFATGDVITNLCLTS